MNEESLEYKSGKIPKELAKEAERLEELAARTYLCFLGLALAVAWAICGFWGQ
ncbi:hypothetical protein [Desulfobacter sp.]|uniref:hypothetical protein n=1 Tax=Desulfobacter sp. TaxID=2294 RepID=UPI003D12DA3D